MSNVTDIQSYLIGFVNEWQSYILDTIAEEIKYGNYFIL